MKQFNNNAPAYNTIRAKITYPQQLYQALSTRAPSQDTALDLGCGNGVSTHRLASYFNDVAGCDIGDMLIQQARQNYPNIPFTVSAAETFLPPQKYDVVTSATSFYWMDRKKVLSKLKFWLKPGGVFCAYKYDFPVVYGPLRGFIEKELVIHWAKYRDFRLTAYDNTAELMGHCSHLHHIQREVFANIIFLSAKEIALFFLSTSYMARYIEQEGGKTYADKFIEKVMAIGGAHPIAINFDTHAFTAVNHKT
ncbi:class I SAM-dependent methyltransferase [Piscirickettsia salmonis]|uniref:class I SAM-dependent methyltransferase n=1 Tax=Piscirickettsia salmonis TaxID=1238 RepID=UPI000F073F33|nr:class I SAM-dependent methyltransferase [Piscirickettsiaceae bacterium NZ-RLO2]